ncbi:urease accessory protein UreF [Notoacmeibacter marinus]|uniref:urease accessory protein UreF n=1 Tax=Notoacmeibacter marinus TaxID=1876515 RepID=UPI000DF3CC04|nr:urease accessory UreF family protein [Notoacmeibacter marinus]
MTAQLLTLLSWLSPVFPTGGFAYSAGLETAAVEGRTTTAEMLENRLATLIEYGAAWNDAVLLAAAHRTADDAVAIDDLATLARALCGSAERLRETLDQGRAFRLAAEPWFTERSDTMLPEAPLPVVIGIAAARHGLPVQDTVGAFLHAFVSAQLQAAIRLSILGQSGAALILARLEHAIETAVQRAMDTDIADLGTCTLAAEIDTLRHETLPGRLFLS